MYVMFVEIFQKITYLLVWFIISTQLRYYILMNNTHINKSFTVIAIIAVGRIHSTI